MTANVIDPQMITAINNVPAKILNSIIDNLFFQNDILIT